MNFLRQFSHHKSMMDETTEIAAPGGIRLDLLVTSAVEGASRAEAQRWIREGHVHVSGKIARAGDRPRAGEMVRISPPPSVPSALEAEAIPLQIVYEDNDLIVIDKPAGLTVHPGAGVHSGTLVNALIAHCKGLSVVGGQERPGIVHRLDRETSGLLVVAKNDTAHRSLAAQISKKTAGREYVALAWGIPEWKEATVRAPIGRDPAQRTRMAVVPEEQGGRPSETLLDILETLPLGCVLKATLRSGRTHQIRVHCAAVQHSLVGDPVYGNHRSRCQIVADPAVRESLMALQRQALHARRLSFDHPATGKQMEFYADPPADWQIIYDLMRRAERR